MTGVYRCSECGKEFPIEPGIYLCDDCSAGQTADQPLRGVLEVVLKGDLPETWASLKNNCDADKVPLWSLQADPLDLMPVGKEFFPKIPVGRTPLWEPEKFREDQGFQGVFIKDDTSNPTGSLKDRASFLVSAFARKHALKRIVVASTGNAGSSMSGIGSASGLEIKLFLPASAPQAKIAQSLQYGADLVKVDGNYDMAFDKSLDYVREKGGLSRNTAYNPLTIEGKKSVSLEIFLQMGCTVPDYVFVPVGDGVIISGVYKGFEDLKAFGLIDKIPHIYCVQAEGSSSVSRALEKGSFEAPVEADTIADSISVDVPRGGLIALKKLQKYGGSALVVSDEEILEAQIRASRSGIFCEPAAAASVAGFIKAKKSLPVDSTVVILVTGNGLKDIASALKGLEQMKGSM